MKLDPESFVARVLVAFGFRLLQIWARTIRFRIEDRGQIRELPLSERLIGAMKPWREALAEVIKRLE